MTAPKVARRERILIIEDSLGVARALGFDFQFWAVMARKNIFIHSACPEEPPSPSVPSQK